MKKYRIFVHGVNFAMRDADDGKVHVLGFYTNRYVEATDVESAENLAMDFVRKELSPFVLNDRSDPPVMYAEEIYELKRFGKHLVPGKGFAWYDEQDDKPS